MKIFVTLGTQVEPFPRLLEYVEKSKYFNNAEIVAQVGHTRYKSKKMKIVKYLSDTKMEEYTANSDLIITHAGTGSIITPLKLNKKIIACARQKKNGEHVDDHQKELVNVLSARGQIISVSNEKEFEKAAERISHFSPKPFISNTENFLSKLKKAIDENS